MKDCSEQEFKVKKIEKGIVIDHIKQGQSINILKVLKIDEKHGTPVLVLMFVPSSTFGKKDIIKIEDIILNKKNISIISLLAPDATINVVRDYAVIEKYRVELPREIEGIIKCPNPGCITNTNEPATPKFSVEHVERESEDQENGVELRCLYCDNIVHGNEITRLLV
ncbi:MAG: aspartate carbamoyltransferase regulatory subunit [Candidatus Paceibacterota bacterium]|jgi:aspartate carbamoyltransferase regulatory subunit